MEGLQPPELDPRTVLDEICAIVVSWFWGEENCCSALLKSLVPTQSTGRWRQ
jgi:hypothetical protein